jgi:DNA polymerase-1
VIDQSEPVGLKAPPPKCPSPQIARYRFLSEIDISIFFESYPGIAAWHRMIKERGSRETRTLTGRRRVWNETPKITALYNTPVQGTAADITKKALGLLHQRLEGTEAKIIGTVHDEIILEVPDETANSAAAILRQTMILAGKAYPK